jgi:ABC-type multidrug transport system ATPase subunit
VVDFGQRHAVTDPTSTDPATVRVDGLEKSYDGTRALGGVSFEVAPGELFGVIGPDGAGKTTLLRILTTVLRPDAGRAWVDGLDVSREHRAIRRRVGYMPGRFALYPDLSVRENLEFFASVFGTTVDEGYRLIAPIYSRIEPFAGRRAGDLSGGMKQKLALSCALVHRPRVLVLDEPTTGVDAVSRVELWEMLGRLAGDGITTLVSTAYMDEAERCDRIALLEGGRLLGDPATPDEVAAGLPGPLVRVRASGGRSTLLAVLRGLPEVERAEVFGEWIHVTGAVGDDAGRLADRVRRGLQDEGFQEIDAEPARASVEDAFMAAMGSAA